MILSFHWNDEVGRKAGAMECLTAITSTYIH
jgi:hypothetical protein